ncbi:AAA family ATPase [Phocoenobacter skyensis]|uniref:AAA family ATPase n=1 Tax=Phocoenobacter skyensis TaxID=97481 RepID=A0AAJ6P3H2_9PAST|nr:AAA family ATPase [Pasteurella skyensis]MDP8175758.1 AAA family ATPase [Pasteurella skyensis]
MIIGIFLRNIKSYNGINYIPLSDGSSFAGLIGQNGVGKSAVLEALDCLFNNREWNFNISVKKSGFRSTTPYISPVFLFRKDSIDFKEHTAYADKLSDYLWSCSNKDYSNNKEEIQGFIDNRELLKRNGITKESHYLLSIGEKYKDKNDKCYSLGFFKPSENIENISDLFQIIKNEYTYIYIPKEIQPEQFTQLETEQIQKLLGTNLTDIISQSVPQKTINEINKGLSKFINDLSSYLNGYVFKSIGEREKNIKKRHIHNLIIENFFSSRILHKEHKAGGQPLKLSDLSSGEQQNSLIDLSLQLLTKYRNSSHKVILAIDEPESSLHISACYEQFFKLAKIKECCRQLLFTTHWYGFIPTADNCAITIIAKEEKESNKKCYYLSNSNSYREAIRSWDEDNKELRKKEGRKIELPIDVQLKGLNDLVQSIIATISMDKAYNWLICEGSSDKLYLEKYLSHLIDKKNLKIIPVGGCSAMNNLYSILATSLDNDIMKDYTKGRVVFLSDTDEQQIQLKYKSNNKKIKWFRLKNDTAQQDTNLVEIDSSSTSPRTEIEDVLDGKLFIDTLSEFQKEYNELKEILDNIEAKNQDLVSFYYLDLKNSLILKLREFFTSTIKYQFANKYCNNESFESYKIPNWVIKLIQEFEK